MVWNKPGLTQAEFNKDDYACRKDAIAAGGTTYYGYGITGRNADGDMYQRCMVAAGYTLQGRERAQALQSGALAGLQQEDAAIRREQEASCVDTKWSFYYSKTACGADKITFDQLADSSKLSAAAKANFSELRNSIDGFIARFQVVQRKAGPVGIKRSDLYQTTAKIQNDRNNLDLYEGKITWGEYNKRRQQIYLDYNEAAKKITS